MTGIRFEQVDLPSSEPLWVLRTGARDAKQVLVLAPFLFEANRTRLWLVGVARALAARGLGAILPDLCGTGESLTLLPPTLEAWHGQVRDLVRILDIRATLAVRSGTILDAAMPEERRWRLSPATGAALLRDLARSASIAAREAGRDERPDVILARVRSEGGRLAGYDLSGSLAADLQEAQPDRPAGRTVRLLGDDRPADHRLAGPMIWRAAEPQAAPALASDIVDDFTAWTATCAAF